MNELPLEPHAVGLNGREEAASVDETGCKTFLKNVNSSRTAPTFKSFCRKVLDPFLDKFTYV